MSIPPIAISASHLHKEFTIHTRSATTLKELVIRNLFVPGELTQYHALRDVSFELQQGQTLAVVGGNGSGKSTLLKIIAGITRPTSGSITVNGRIAALLELGSGFQPEFTGMENIFLQCSIMGLSRQQILARLDSIISFAELDQFIHSPLKRYSSGMTVRLAFSIALHVDADILLLDEVMAVGDQAFQEKCKDKIRELRRAGKSLLFVSHMLEQVRSVADYVLWLEKGTVLSYGPAEEVLPVFYESLHRNDTSQREGISVQIDNRVQAALPNARYAAKSARIADVRFLDHAGQESRSFRRDTPFQISITCEVLEPLPGLQLTCALGTLDAVRAAWFDSGSLLPAVEPGRYEFHVSVEQHHLHAGLYLASFLLGPPGDIATVYDLILRLHAISFYEEGHSAAAVDQPPGELVPWGIFKEGWTSPPLTPL